MCLKKSLATPSEVIVFRQGVIITPYIRPWLTMTMIELNPPEGGRSVMRSTKREVKGAVVVEGIRTRGGVTGCVSDFIC
jgi:hypothetical protein